MDTVTIFFIAISLAMDAFAVAAASGVIIRRRRLHHALRFGLSFGLFQMVMPVLGWASGRVLRPVIAAVDHWIAFLLLGLIGAKMIIEALQIEKFERAEESFSTRVLLGLSVATSIDALVIGMSFAFLNVAIISPVLVIGIVTFLLSFFGFLLGNKFGHLFENKIEILGGLVLVGIGLKILLEHLCAR